MSSAFSPQPLHSLPLKGRAIACGTAPLLPPPSELGFTRVRHLTWPKSDISDFGWGRVGVGAGSELQKKSLTRPPSLTLRRSTSPTRTRVYPSSVFNSDQSRIYPTLIGRGERKAATCDSPALKGGRGPSRVGGGPFGVYRQLQSTPHPLIVAALQLCDLPLSGRGKRKGARSRTALPNRGATSSLFLGRIFRPEKSRACHIWQERKNGPSLEIGPIEGPKKEIPEKNTHPV